MSGQQRLAIVPMTLRTANAFVGEHHRHHKPVRGCCFSLGVKDSGGMLRGVAIVGRPSARMLQDGLTAEITRVATDGCPNACSALYMAAWRACREIGYRRLLTYILISEPGTSLQAIKSAGWKLVNERAGGGSWSRDGRPRTDQHPLELKQRWEIVAVSTAPSPAIGAEQGAQTAAL